MPHRYIWRQLRTVGWRLQRFVKYRILHVDDTPHRIALGVAIGFFVTWTPTVGLQMALTVALCMLLRANKLVGVPFVWISNPVTIVPIYYPSYLLGVALTPGASTKTLDDWRDMVARVFDGDLSWWDRVTGFWDFGLEIAAPLWAGSLVVALAIGGVMYAVTYFGVVRYRRRFGHPSKLRKGTPTEQAADAPEGSDQDE